VRSPRFLIAVAWIGREARCTGSTLYAARIVSPSWVPRSNYMGMRTSCPPHLLYEKRHGHPKTFPFNTEHGGRSCRLCAISFWSCSPGRIVPLPRWDQKRKNPHGFRAHDSPLRKWPTGHGPPFLSPLSLFLFISGPSRSFPTASEFPFYSLNTTTLHARFCSRFFIFLRPTPPPHQTRWRVRWLRPPRLRPKLFRI